VAWYYAPDPIVASEALDMDAINAALQAAHSEVSGELNEQNWAQDTLQSAMAGALSFWRVDPSFAIITHHTFDEADPFAGPTQALQKKTTWTPVVGAELTFDTAGGDVHVVASWQCSHSSSNATSTGFMYCFEVDGNPMVDSMIGSGDLNNDMVRQGVSSGGSFTTFNVYTTSPGFMSRKVGFSLELITYLKPGQHVIRLVSRMVDPDNAAPNNLTTQVEMYALDLWS
jgi:hypothetical protein